MRNFKDFGIATQTKGFEGDKINMSKVLNREIEVHQYKIVPSKYPEKGNGQRLDMEILIDGRKRVVFSASSVLQEMIQQVPKSEFPFKTTIINENEHFEFT